MVSAMALAAGLLSLPAELPAEAAPVTTSKVQAKKPAKTSAVEKRRSKRVKTPKLSWHRCYRNAKCATVTVPLDYDKPKGKKISFAVAKRPARKKKIGTLFVNPDGPGDTGTNLVQNADEYLTDALLDRFDIVGFNPRGTVFGKQGVRCFRSVQKNKAFLRKVDSMAFPYTAKEEKTLRTAYDQHAKACSTSGKPLTGAVSTTEVARDLDLLRRAVGDKKLTYLGFAYGSYLGEVYANLYPDRVRAIAIDGVLNPVAWAGTKKTQNTPATLRLDSALAAEKALHQVLELCDQAGPSKCRFSAGDPVANFEKIAQRLRKAPLSYVDPDTGQHVTMTYAYFVATTLRFLEGESAEFITDMAADLWDVLYPPSEGAAGTAQSQKAVEHQQQSGSSDSGAPYRNYRDVPTTVMCTDSRNGKNLAKFGTLAKEADKKAPYFGRASLWSNPSCSSKKWTVKDEDAYHGPFTKRTSSTVLIVGNYWNPDHGYSDAVTTSKLMPNSRLLSSNSWGDIAYQTSACVTNAMDNYLLRQKLPPEGTICTGDYRPFTG